MNCPKRITIAILQLRCGANYELGVMNYLNADMNKITIERLEKAEGEAFEKICLWCHEWWGVRDGLTLEQVRYNMKHSLGTGKQLPQTFIARINGKTAGMYQLSMSDDLQSRPDLYPWLINVYVEEDERGKGVCREMMKTVAENAKGAGLEHLYLYTKHTGLYEKFGWEFIETAPTFRADSPVERVYMLKVESRKVKGTFFHAEVLK